jgi:putative ubiquitin-RnfH superfamily antitoxin RatB of RatAB toxin-antitoxin module
VKIDVVHAAAGAQDCVTVDLPEGATAADAIRCSGLVAAWQLDLADLVIAVRGRVIVADARLSDGDRLELLRPVSADPKDVRRRRAAMRRSVASSGAPTTNR